MEVRDGGREGQRNRGREAGGRDPHHMHKKYPTFLDPYLSRH